MTDGLRGGLQMVSKATAGMCTTSALRPRQGFSDRVV